jgi:chemotaxis protein MotB
MARRRRARDDAHAHDRWVVSYADFITLLLAFFVVMYSISSVNEGKYRVLSESLEGIFSGIDRSFDPIPVGDRPTHSQGPEVGIVELPQSADASTEAESLAPPEGQESQTLLQIEAEVSERFDELIEGGGLTLSSNRLWMEIEISSGLLFGSGNATPHIDADAIFEGIARILKPFDSPIHVEGFTDNKPIQSSIFPSNWELSAARAASVVRMLSHFGVAPERMAAVGYGEYQPVVSNLTPRGRSKNRRVVIIVSRDTQVRRSLTGYGPDFRDEADVSQAPSRDSDQLDKRRINRIETEAGVLFTRDEADSSK